MSTATAASSTAPTSPTLPGVRSQHLRILSLLTEIEPLLAPSAAADPTTLDLRWSVLARWAMVQIELDRDRWLAALAGDPTPAGRERARAAIELGESLYGRLQRHDRLYAQRDRLAADPHGFVEATGRLARTLRRMVTMAVQTCAGGVGGLVSGPGTGLPTGLAGRSGGGPRGGLRVRPGSLLGADRAWSRTLPPGGELADEAAAKRQHADHEDQPGDDGHRFADRPEPFHRGGRGQPVAEIA